MEGLKFIERFPRLHEYIIFFNLANVDLDHIVLQGNGHELIRFTKVLTEWPMYRLSYLTNFMFIHLGSTLVENSSILSF